MRSSRIGGIVLALILVAVGGVLAYFAVQNANRYWEDSHAPDDAVAVKATVTRVDTEEVCGRTSKSTSHCSTEVDGLQIELADGSSHHVHAHAVFSPGDKVSAFQDGDGDWQVVGAFTKGWAVRTVGATGLGALALFFIAIASLRPRKETPSETPEAPEAADA